MYFPRALALSKIQRASSRFWTWIDNSISYDNNSHAKCVSLVYQSKIFLFDLLFSLVLRNDKCMVMKIVLLPSFKWKEIAYFKNEHGLFFFFLLNHQPLILMRTISLAARLPYIYLGRYKAKIVGHPVKFEFATPTIDLARLAFIQWIYLVLLSVCFILVFTIYCSRLIV